MFALSVAKRRIGSTNCVGTETKPTEKCIKSGCARMGAMRGKNMLAGRLAYCGEHNVCTKCGQSTSWSHLICFNCDPPDKCKEPGCENLPAGKMKGRAVIMYGSSMICGEGDNLQFCCEHDVCNKCGKETIWDNLICWTCDLDE